MPVYESSCVQIDCQRRGQRVEWIGKYDDADPKCRYCGAQTERQISNFAMPFCGAITARYLDGKLEGGHAKDGGHWAWRKKDTLSGKPEPVFIETFQQQRDYAHAEGLAMPGDAGPGFISGDGKTFKPVSECEAKEFVEHSNREAARAAPAQP